MLQAGGGMETEQKAVTPCDTMLCMNRSHVPEAPRIYGEL